MTPGILRDMNATQTRQVDRFGNVSYRIERDGEHIGTVHKTCSGYQAEPVGVDYYMNASSIKKARALIEARALLVGAPSGQTGRGVTTPDTMGA
jgi:hypothetical protein